MPTLGRCRRSLVVLGCAAIIAACQSPIARDDSAALPELGRDGPQGYLQPAALPDSLALLPPPPSAGSPALALDEEYARRSLALRDTPAWTLAILDADLAFPAAAEAFSCALDAPVTEQDEPHLYVLL